MVVGARSTVAAACVALLLVASGAGAQTPVLSPATVSGTNISFTWSATAGATSYRLDAGLAPGTYVASLPVGTGTSFAVTAPAIGVYYARVGCCCQAYRRSRRQGSRACPDSGFLFG